MLAHRTLTPVDQDAIQVIVAEYRAATSLLAYNTIWRTRLLLSSRVWHPEQDIQVWMDASGELIGLSFLWSRRPESSYRALERAARPGSWASGVLEDMLVWGAQRGAQTAAQHAAALTLYAAAPRGLPASEEAMLRRGYTPVPDNPQDKNLYFTRSLDGELPGHSPLPGRIIRSLQEPLDLPAYQSGFDFTPVNPQHRLEQLASDEYAHLVVVDADGSFSAYCEVSYCLVEWRLDRRRIGWVDYIGVREDRRGQGLGKAVLLAGMQHLRRRGAELAALVTASRNTPALGLYEGLGFTRIDPAPEILYQQPLSGEQNENPVPG